MGEVSKFAPVVSVAMITYNHERFITKAIESVLAQRTRFPIELVIGEDASSDDTRRHIEAFRAQAPEVIRTLIRPIYSELGIIPEVALAVQSTSSLHTPPEE